MRKLFIFTILVVSLVLTGCVKQTEKNAFDETNSIQLANPASVYCEEQGGELEMRTEPAGVYGVCKFSDNTECEEWAFFRNECQAGDIEQTKNDIDNDEIIVEKGTSASSPQQGSGQAVQGNDKIKIFNIEDNQTVYSPLTISGQGVAFENNLIVELRNSDHATMVKEFTTIKSGEVGVIGDYAITLNFEFSNTKEGFIAVYEQSAKDGSELNLVEIPVKFGNLDVSTWQTYKNEEYGFEFKCPGEWCSTDSLNNPLNLKVIKYSSAPKILNSDDYAATITQSDIDKIRVQINERENDKYFNLGDKNAQLILNYDVPGGGFYKEIRFFMDKDLIRLYVLLPLGPFSWPSDRDKVAELEKEIEARKIDVKTLSVLNNFNQILSTLKFTD